MTYTSIFIALTFSLQVACIPTHVAGGGRLRVVQVVVSDRGQLVVALVDPAPSDSDVRGPVTIRELAPAPRDIGLLSPLARLLTKDDTILSLNSTGLVEYDLRRDKKSTLPTPARRPLTIGADGEDVYMLADGPPCLQRAKWSEWRWETIVDVCVGHLLNSGWSAEGAFSELKFDNEFVYWTDSETGVYRLRRRVGASASIELVSSVLGRADYFVLTRVGEIVMYDRHNRPSRLLIMDTEGRITATYLLGSEPLTSLVVKDGLLLLTREHPATSAVDTPYNPRRRVLCQGVVSMLDRATGRERVLRHKLCSPRLFKSGDVTVLSTVGTDIMVEKF